MPIHVEAVYENGVLRPLEPLALPEHEQVHLALNILDEGDEMDRAFVERCRAEIAQHNHHPTLEEVHNRLSHIPGSFAELIIAERGDR